jgi:hypothetical protein
VLLLEIEAVLRGRIHRACGLHLSAETPQFVGDQVFPTGIHFTMFVLLDAA